MVLLQKNKNFKKKNYFCCVEISIETFIIIIIYRVVLFLNFEFNTTSIIKYERKNIIITGGLGFIGSNLIKLLSVRYNFNVVNIDKLLTHQIKVH